MPTTSRVTLNTVTQDMLNSYNEAMTRVVPTGTWSINYDTDTVTFVDPRSIGNSDDMRKAYLDRETEQVNNFTVSGQGLYLSVDKQGTLFVHNDGRLLFTVGEKITTPKREKHLHQTLTRLAEREKKELAVVEKLRAPKDLTTISYWDWGIEHDDSELFTIDERQAASPRATRNIWATLDGVPF